MRSNEEIVNLIARQIDATKRANEKLNNESTRLFNMIDVFIGDISNAKTQDKNADNLADAISNYIENGEYDIKDLENELLRITQERKPNT